jgi:hypothetical protein
MSLASIHRFIDARQWPTYRYEQLAALGLEAMLLYACALPVATDWRGRIVLTLVGILRGIETEARREEASVMGRHAERGGVLPLPGHKVARAAARARLLEIVSWIWPGLILIALAVEARQITMATLLAIGAGLVRAAWSRWTMPAWRRSRVAWRAAHPSAEGCHGRS